MNKSTDKTDRNTTVQELKDLRQKFILERGWETSRTGRNIATSIIVEAAELLEHFQWGEEADHNEIAKELSDVLAYCFDMALMLDIDITTVYHAKTAHAEQKYPVKLFYPGEHNDDAYHRIKKDYRENHK